MGIGVELYRVNIVILYNLRARENNRLAFTGKFKFKSVSWLLVCLKIYNLKC